MSRTTTHLLASPWNQHHYLFQFFLLLARSVATPPLTQPHSSVGVKQEPTNNSTCRNTIGATKNRLTMNLPRPRSTAAIAVIVGLLLQLCDQSLGPAASVDAFQNLGPSLGSRPSQCSSLEMKGMGMGVQQGKKKKVSAGASNKGLQKTQPNGAGNKQQPFNVNASLLRLEKKYDELSKAAAKNLLQENDYEDEAGDIVTSEYVVAARAPGYITDWVPIAQICLARPFCDAGDGDPLLLRAVVSCYCRELSLVASLGSRVFQSVPRHLLEYAVETSDSFHKHVMAIVDDKASSSSSTENTMTKQQARQVLQLEGAGDSIGRSEIKQQYRKLSFAHHPDRFVGTERSDADRQSSNEQYGRIQLAYETLSSGIRNDASSSSSSWYQSLGGRARTDFVGPIELVSLTEAQTMLPVTVQSALAGLQPDLVQSFVTRSRQQ